MFFVFKKSIKEECDDLFDQCVYQEFCRLINFADFLVKSGKFSKNEIIDSLSVEKYATEGALITATEVSDVCVSSALDESFKILLNYID